MLVRIAVFDSGLGSLSVIKAIQKQTKCEIVYFADQKNFPYGKKTKSELEKIIKNTISMLKEKFNPDFIVIASNTPSILLNINSAKIFTVTPPIKKAQKKSHTKNIAILATEATIKSKSLSKYILKQKISKTTKIHKINCSKFVELVESGDFLTNKNKTRKIIRQILQKDFERRNIDVATLSSTHLPFLKDFLEEQFPEKMFLDPAEELAKKINKKIKSSKRNTLKIYSTDITKTFENNLKKLGIKNKIISL